MKHKISIKTQNEVLTVDDFKAQGLTKKDVVGIVIQTETIGLILSIDQWEEIWCSSKNCQVINEACGEAKALQTLRGLELTRKIVEQNKRDGEDMTAALRCFEYNKGGLQWHLPCLYELGTVIAYRDEVNKILRMLGADLIDKDQYGWSSSEHCGDNAWGVGFGDGSFGTSGKYNSFVVRAVSAFEPLERGDFSSPSGNGISSFGTSLTEKAAIDFLKKLGYKGELIKTIKV